MAREAGCAESSFPATQGSSIRASTPLKLSFRTSPKTYHQLSVKCSTIDQGDVLEHCLWLTEVSTGTRYGIRNSRPPAIPCLFCAGCALTARNDIQPWVTYSPPRTRNESTCEKRLRWLSHLRPSPQVEWRYSGMPLTHSPRILDKAQAKHSKTPPRSSTRFAPVRTIFPRPCESTTRNAALAQRKCFDFPV